MSKKNKGIVTLKLENGKFLNLKLVAGDSDRVDLIATDDNGNPLWEGYLVGINPAGELVRHVGVSDKLGLQLKKDGRIKSFKG